MRTVKLRDRFNKALYEDLRLKLSALGIVAMLETSQTNENGMRIQKACLRVDFPDGDALITLERINKALDVELVVIL